MKIHIKVDKTKALSVLQSIEKIDGVESILAIYRNKM
jgi:hypothetical protein